MMSVKCVRFVYAVVALTAAAAVSAAPSLPTAAVDNAASEDIGPPLNLAQCRAQCLQRFSSASGSASSGAGAGAGGSAASAAAAAGPNPQPDTSSPTCLQTPDCYMCWENCQLLQSNFPVWGAMCSEKSICYPGCKQACRFHKHADRRPAPRLLAGGRPAVVVTGAVTGSTASWPAPEPPLSTNALATPVVYVLMRRQDVVSPPTWTQIAQTVERSAPLTQEVADSPGELRILAVGPDGLLAVLRPILVPSTSTTESPMTSTPSTSSPTTSATPPALRRINTAIAPEQRWVIREVSLTRQRSLVLADLRWAARAPRGDVYLVTWEVDGGGLRGNLFTDATRVTLSLWPDTVYHIQVQLVSGTKERTSLRLDTRRASASPSPPPPPPPPPPQVTETAARSPLLMLASAPNKRHVDARLEEAEARRLVRTPEGAGVDGIPVHGFRIGAASIGSAAVAAVAAAALVVLVLLVAGLTLRCRRRCCARDPASDTAPFLPEDAVKSVAAAAPIPAATEAPSWRHFNMASSWTFGQSPQPAVPAAGQA